MIQKFNEKTKKRIVRDTTLACSILAATAATLALMSPAMTLADEDPHCGLIEHAHTDECYEQTIKCQKTEEVIVSSDSQADNVHTHDDSCYENVLKCDHEEHEHELICFSDFNAGLAHQQDWEKDLPEELSGNYNSDLVLVAKSQIGQKESEDNFLVEKADEQEIKKGYTRYGEWFGNSHQYRDWNGMFLSFVFHYAGMDDVLPKEADPTTLAEHFAKENIWFKDNQYQIGDVLYLESKDEADRPVYLAGIISDIEFEPESSDSSEETDIDEDRIPVRLKVIFGDYENKVEEVELESSDEKILGYGSVSALQKAREEAEGQKLNSSETQSDSDASAKADQDAAENEEKNAGEEEQDKNQKEDDQTFTATQNDTDQEEKEQTVQSNQTDRDQITSETETDQTSAESENSGADQNDAGSSESAAENADETENSDQEATDFQNKNTDETENESLNKPAQDTGNKESSIFFSAGAANQYGFQIKETYLINELETADQIQETIDHLPQNSVIESKRWNQQNDLNEWMAYYDEWTDTLMAIQAAFDALPESSKQQVDTKKFDSCLKLLNEIADNPGRKTSFYSPYSKYEKLFYNWTWELVQNNKPVNGWEDKLEEYKTLISELEPQIQNLSSFQKLILDIAPVKAQIARLENLQTLRKESPALKPEVLKNLLFEANGSDLKKDARETALEKIQQIEKLEEMRKGLGENTESWIDLSFFDESKEILKDILTRTLSEQGKAVQERLDQFPNRKVLIEELTEDQQLKEDWERITAQYLITMQEIQNAYDVLEEADQHGVSLVKLVEATSLFSDLGSISKLNAQEQELPESSVILNNLFKSGEINTDTVNYARRIQLELTEMKAAKEDLPEDLYHLIAFEKVDAMFTDLHDLFEAFAIKDSVSALPAKDEFHKQIVSDQAVINQNWKNLLNEQIDKVNQLQLRADAIDDLYEPFYGQSKLNAYSKFLSELDTALGCMDEILNFPSVKSLRDQLLNDKGQFKDDALSIAKAQVDQYNDKIKQLLLDISASALKEPLIFQNTAVVRACENGAAFSAYLNNLNSVIRIDELLNQLPDPDTLNNSSIPYGNTEEELSSNEISVMEMASIILEIENTYEDLPEFYKGMTDIEKAAEVKSWLNEINGNTLPDNVQKVQDSIDELNDREDLHDDVKQHSGNTKTTWDTYAEGFILDRSEELKPIETSYEELESYEQLLIDREKLDENLEYLDDLKDGVVVQNEINTIGTLSQTESQLIKKETSFFSLNALSDGNDLSDTENYQTVNNWESIAKNILYSIETAENRKNNLAEDIQGLIESEEMEASKSFIEKLIEQQKGADFLKKARELNEKIEALASIDLQSELTNLPANDEGNQTFKEKVEKYQNELKEINQRYTFHQENALTDFEKAFVNYSKVEKFQDELKECMETRRRQTDPDNFAGELDTWENLIEVSQDVNPYSLAYLLNNYNVVSLSEQPSSLYHTTGLVMIRGDLYQTSFIADRDMIPLSAVYSYVGGKVYPGASYGLDGQPDFLPIYLSTLNTIDKVNGNKNVTVNGQAYYTRSSDAFYSNAFVDWNRLYKTVQSESDDLAALKPHVKITKDNISSLKNNEYASVELNNGGQLIIDITKSEKEKGSLIIDLDAEVLSMANNVCELRRSSEDLTGTQKNVIINIRNSGVVSMPNFKVINNGGEISSNEYSAAGLDVIWNLPNAGLVNLFNSNWYGHVVAPNAVVTHPGGNYNGAIVSAAFQTTGAEGHMHRYYGNSIYYKDVNDEFNLPETGGTGLNSIYTTGSILIGAALACAVVYSSKKRKV